MQGMNATTGKPLSGIDHLIQSIRDILTTPIGTRVMRRDYGSRLFDLIDSPINGDVLIEAYAAVAEALDKWEPRFRLTKVKAYQAEAGKLTIDCYGIYLLTGDEVSFEEILV